NDDAVTVAKNTDPGLPNTVEFNPLVNDNDADGDPLTIVTASAPAFGVLSLLPTRIKYAPIVDFVGTDTFTYTITDGKGAIATATVTVTVPDANTAPVANDDLATTPEDTPLVVIALTNDTDADNDPLAIVGASGALHGSVSFTATQIDYTPNADYVGQDRVGYIIDDGNGGQATASVIITVTSVNDAPVWTVVPNPQFPEDTVGSVDLAPAVLDADGDPITFSVVTDGTSVACTLAGSVLTLTPIANFNGADTCVIGASDSIAPVVTQSIPIIVTSVNDLPVANDDSAATFVDTPLTLDPRINDTDVDLDVLSIVGVGAATSGIVSFTATDVTYTPNLGFNGTDSFTYTIDDANGGQATATVTVTVSILNNAPVANDDSISVAEDGFFTFDPTINDTDADNDVLTITGVTQGTNGSVTFTTNDVTYTPAADFNGADSFTYTITDGIASATATVSVTVTPVNDAPVLAAVPVQSFNEDTPTVVDLAGLESDVDGDVLTFSVDTQGTDVTCSFTGSVLTIIPALNFNGAESCIVKVNDGTLDSNLQIVSITVVAVNDAPVLSALPLQTIPEDGGVFTIDLTTFASDIDADVMTAVLIAENASQVDCTVSGTDLIVSYNPALNFNGTATCDVAVNDGNLDSNTQTLTIDVTGVNDAPVLAAVPAQSFNEDAPTTVDLVGLASDVDGNPLTFIVDTQGTNVTCSFTGSVLSMTPLLNFNGADSCVVKVNDGTVDSNLQTVSITVVAVNDAPVLAAVPAQTFAEDAITNVDLAAFGSDVEGSPLTFSVQTNGTNVVCSFAGSVLTMTPPLNFNGVDSCVILVNDGLLDSNTQTVSITGTPVNDA
ncbi:MAG: Ig-like domain-containing protein, partial [Nanoarchaeota archaeon]